MVGVGIDPLHHAHSITPDHRGVRGARWHAPRMRPTSSPQLPDAFRRTRAGRAAAGTRAHPYVWAPNFAIS